MYATDELEDFFSERTQTYLFLSQVFFKELTEEAIQKLASADYPESTGNEYLDQGYHMVRRFFRFGGNDMRTQLACEYARIFLSAGMYTEARDLASPYESVFTSEEQLVMQESRDDVYRFYLQDGFKVDPDLHEPEDHLSFELEYLSSMSDRAGEAAARGDWVELTENAARQREFIATHMLNWLPRLRETAQKYAQLTFYIGMLLIAEGYLRDSDAVLDEILQEAQRQQVHATDQNLVPA